MKPPIHIIWRRATLVFVAALVTMLPIPVVSIEFAKVGSADFAGYTTRCAGYIAIAQYEAGLTFCNRALEMYEVDWRIKLNRAAARFGFAQVAFA